MKCKKCIPIPLQIPKAIKEFQMYEATWMCPKCGEANHIASWIKETPNCCMFCRYMLSTLDKAMVNMERVTMINDIP